MDTLIGLELCTSGTAEMATSKGNTTIKTGTIMILSPVFPMLETYRSDDYSSVVLQDSIENIFPLFAKNISPSTSHLSAITPYMHLNDEQQQHFLQRAETLKQKEQQLQKLQHPVQQKLMTTIIALLKQETLLEHVFLFSHQLLQEEQGISHKRQILMSFLLSLNDEYRRHRAVSYYAGKQGLTPRHFSDIVKQESGHTPMEWITQITITQAKNLLQKPDIQIKQVAEELGFPEQFTFRKYFKSYTDMSPTEYQNKFSRHLH